jgi:small-conductance mechanosensitive channel
MEPSEYQDRRQRGTCLSLMMAAMVVGFFALLLIVATGGWAIYAIWIGAAIVLFGAIHYLLWGRMMLQQTAGDREVEEMRQRAEEREEEPPAPGSNGIKRLH